MTTIIHETASTAHPHEAAMADLMADTYVHAGRPPVDTLGEGQRQLPRWCPRWCEEDHRQLVVDGASVFEASEHRRYVLEMHSSTLHNPVDGRVERIGTGEVDVFVRQEPHPYLQDCGNGSPLVEVVVCPGGELSRRASAAAVPLTAGEARSLAAALVVAADFADGLR